MFLNKQDVIQLHQNSYGMVALSGKIARYKIFVNVGGGGGDMAFNSGGDERIAFGPMAKGQKKYGATTSSRKKNEQVVIYNIQKGDTLAGIAIKFGISTEQIRRCNHLWTNDSLFLRDKLLIPVPEEGSKGDDGASCSSFGSSSNLCSPHSSENGEFKMRPHWTHPLCSDDSEEEEFASTSSKILTNGSSSSSAWCSNNGLNSHNHPPSSTSSSPLVFKNKVGSNSDNNEEEDGGTPTQASPTPTSSTSSSRRCTIVDHSEKSVDEFLSRIDSVIASTKKQAKHKEGDMEKTKPWVTFDSDSESNSDHRSGTSITRQGRHLRYSLRKLEKAQEELFQL